MARTKNIRGIAGTCRFNETNVRPATWNIHDNCLGDCTTRALTFALNGEMSYNQVETEQYRLASILGTVRNRMGTWDQILIRKGWRWIQFSKCISRGEIAVRLAKRLPGVTALAVSRTHVACVKGGELIDTWDSRGGKCYAMLVPGEVLNEAVWAIDLTRDDVDCTVVGKPTFIRSTKRRRRRHWVWG